MQSYNIYDIIDRSSSTKFEDTTLSKILNDIPIVTPDGPWLGGGAIRRTLLGQEPNTDIDFFFHDEKQFNNTCQYLEGRAFKKISETKHHKTFIGVLTDSKIERKIQCINFKYYNNAQEVLDSFDYTICMFVYDGDRLYCGDYALWDLARRKLAINKITYPVSTMRRMLKYCNQGFTACSGCMQTILLSIENNPKLKQNMEIEYVD